MRLTEKRQISAGDVVYIIGKYSFYRDEMPKVIEVQVAYTARNRVCSYPTKGHGTFSFAQSDLGKSVFLTREEAEAALTKMKDGASNG